MGTIKRRLQFSKITVIFGLLLLGVFSGLTCQPIRAADNTASRWTVTESVNGQISATAIVQTGDGGYAIAGTNVTGSYDSSASIWFCKLDASGNLQWEKVIDGAESVVWPPDRVSLIITKDGGFAICASTWVNRTDTAGGNDFWLIKLDESGNVQFIKTYGGPKDDFARSIIQTDDGGYALAGSTEISYETLAWLVKVDASGNMLWNVTYGSFDTYALALVQTDDGGYALTGEKFGSPNAGWLIKVNSSGKMQWEQTFFGSDMPNIDSIVLSDDGGYTLAGYLEGTLGIGKGNSYALLVKFDSTGTMQWNRVYIGSFPYSLSQSNGNYYLTAANTSRVIMWNQTYYEGGTGGYAQTASMKTNSLTKTSDGGYALTGEMTTMRLYRNPGFIFGSLDFWLIKVDSSGNMQWNYAYGDGLAIEEAKAGIQTNDGGYALAGYTISGFLVVKTDGSGLTAESAFSGPASTNSPTPTLANSSTNLPTPTMANPSSSPYSTTTSFPSNSPSPTVPEFFPSFSLLFVILIALAICAAIFRRGEPNRNHTPFTASKQSLRHIAILFTHQ